VLQLLRRQLVEDVARPQRQAVLAQGPHGHAAVRGQTRATGAQASGLALRSCDSCGGHERSVGRIGSRVALQTRVGHQIQGSFGTAGGLAGL